jgi:predicted nucleic-acid-binding Zn-ribbon protein
MSDFHPVCPKCAKPMERGHVPDAGYGQVIQSKWAPGDAVPRRFFGGIQYDVNEQIPMMAYRCPACGYVELYARPA